MILIASYCLIPDYDLFNIFQFYRNQQNQLKHWFPCKPQIQRNWHWKFSWNSDYSKTSHLEIEMRTKGCLTFQRASFSFQPIPAEDRQTDIFNGLFEAEILTNPGTFFSSTFNLVPALIIRQKFGAGPSGRYRPGHAHTPPPPLLRPPPPHHASPRGGRPHPPAARWSSSCYRFHGNRGLMSCTEGSHFHSAYIVLRSCTNSSYRSCIWLLQGTSNISHSSMKYQCPLWSLTLGLWKASSSHWRHNSLSILWQFLMSCLPKIMLFLFELSITKYKEVVFCPF